MDKLTLHPPGIGERDWKIGSQQIRCHLRIWREWCEDLDQPREICFSQLETNSCNTRIAQSPFTTFRPNIGRIYGLPILHGIDLCYRPAANPPNQGFRFSNRDTDHGL
jgi:hypothetical protein